MLIEGKADGQVGTMAGTGIVTKSVEEYAHAIVDLVNDEQRRKQLGQAARTVANESYALKPVVSRFEEIFTEIAARYRGRRFSRINKVMCDYVAESNVIFTRIRARLPFLHRFFC
jgi:replicative DNA helicase